MAKPEQPKLDFDISASTRLPASVMQELDRFADENSSDRSKTLRAFILAVWEKAKASGAAEQGLKGLCDRISFEAA